MKRRILLVDDEVAVLLTLKAVLEISGFDVDTAASGREGMSKLRTHQYHMVITDMRMESDAAGIEVIAAARLASYHPAVALLTAFPVAEEDWQALGAHKMLVKPMHTRTLLQQIEKLLASHEAQLNNWSLPVHKAAPGNRNAKPSTKKAAARTAPAKQPAAKRVARALHRAVKTAKP
jgi:DNA-binding response OmpR family regulator